MERAVNKTLFILLFLLPVIVGFLIYGSIDYYNDYTFYQHHVDFIEDTIVIAGMSSDKHMTVLLGDLVDDDTDEVYMFILWGPNFENRFDEIEKGQIIQILSNRNTSDSIYYDAVSVEKDGVIYVTESEGYSSIIGKYYNNYSNQVKVTISFGAIWIGYIVFYYTRKKRLHGN